MVDETDKERFVRVERATTAHRDETIRLLAAQLDRLEKIHALAAAIVILQAILLAQAIFGF